MKTIKVLQEEFEEIKESGNLGKLLQLSEAIDTQIMEFLNEYHS